MLLQLAGKTTLIGLMNDMHVLYTIVGIDIYFSIGCQLRQKKSSSEWRLWREKAIPFGYGDFGGGDVGGFQVVLIDIFKGGYVEIFGIWGNGNSACPRTICISELNMIAQ